MEETKLQNIFAQDKELDFANIYYELFVDENYNNIIIQLIYCLFD